MLGMLQVAVRRDVVYIFIRALRTYLPLKSEERISVASSSFRRPASFYDHSGAGGSEKLASESNSEMPS